MDILKPSLTEPGIKYFLHQTLKQCHITKNGFHTTVFNVGMLLGFMIILAAILFFKYKGKITPAEKHKKDYEKQQYILSKINVSNFLIIDRHIWLVEIILLYYYIILYYGRYADINSRRIKPITRNNK